MTKTQAQLAQQILNTAQAAAIPTTSLEETVATLQDQLNALTGTVDGLTTDLGTLDAIDIVLANFEVRIVALEEAVFPPP